MLKEGIKKEMMFFTRSFRMWGVLMAAVLFAIVAPLLIKLSFVMLESLDGMMGENSEYMENTGFNGERMEFGIEFGDADIDMDMDVETGMGKFGAVSALGDLTSTLMLIFMLVIMYAAGGELKKRSMIIPQNAGLSSKLYVLPKFIVYPVSAVIFAFCGMWIGFGVSTLVFPGVQVSVLGVLEAAFAAAVYDAFIIVLYLTLGLCTAKAGIATVIMYGGSTILSALFSALGADKFHPFTLQTQAQSAVVEESFDALNYWGSMGITVLIMILCYFVTLFVISARRIDNRGKEEMLL